MHLRIELFVWLKGSANASNDVPSGKEYRARDVLHALVDRDCQTLLKISNLPTDFLSPHIETFVTELGGEDRDHTYRFGNDGISDVRVVIENVSPATLRAQNEFIAAWWLDGIGNS